MTAGTTAVAVVTGGWPFADVIVVARPDSEVFSAAVCDGNADLASVANVAALVWTLLSGLKGAQAILDDVDTAEAADGGLEVGGVGAVSRLAAAASGGQPGQDQDGGRISSYLREPVRSAGLMCPPRVSVFSADRAKPPCPGRDWLVS